MAMKMLADNLHDAAVVTASSEGMSIDYTQRSDRPLVWRSADLQPQVITATLSEIHFIDCIALTRHNLGSLGAVRVELIQQGQVVYDSGLLSSALLVPAGRFVAGVDGWGETFNDKMPTESSLVIHWLDAPVAADQYRITVTAQTDEGYLEIGRIFAGLSFSPSVNFNWGLDVEWIESGEHVPTEAGSLRTVGLGELRRRFQLQLDWLVDGDRQQLINRLAKIGRGADLLVSLYQGSGEMQELEHAMVCRREGNLSHVHSHNNNWQAPMAFIEV